MTTSKEEALQARIDELEARIAANKTAPEFSSVFIHPEGGKKTGFISWSGLSETKKFLESKANPLLMWLLDVEEKETFTSREFHEALEKALTVLSR